MLAELTRVLEPIAAVAQATDLNNRLPVEAMRELAGAGFFGYGVEPALGGQGAPTDQLRLASELVAAACGVTAFVQVQHTTATLRLGRCPNADLQDRYLDDFMAGRRWCGVAFGHLRRPGPPCVTATPVAGGHRFQGFAPWFTGWGLFEYTILGGTLPDGRYLFALTRLDRPEVTASPPLDLAVMRATETVTLQLEDLFVPDSETVLIQTREELAVSDQGGTVRNAALSLGVVRASLELLACRSGLETLRADLSAQAEEIRELSRRHDVTPGDRLSGQIRSLACDLGLRASQAALIATGGGGILRSETAQRLVREAAFYPLVGLSAPMRAELLGILSRSRASVS